MVPLLVQPGSTGSIFRYIGKRECALFVSIAVHSSAFKDIIRLSYFHFGNSLSVRKRDNAN